MKNPRDERNLKRRKIYVAQKIVLLELLAKVRN